MLLLIFSSLFLPFKVLVEERRPVSARLVATKNAIAEVVTGAEASPSALLTEVAIVGP